MLSFLFLISFKILIFFMVFHNFILMCVGVYFCEFILHNSLSLLNPGVGFLY